MATDKSGNSANASFSVTVKDAEKPVLAATPSVSRSTDPGLCSALVNYSLPLATDNCPGVTVNCQPPSGTTFAKGVTTVNCTATDASLNSATSDFTVTVSDTEKPRVNTQTLLALAAPGTFSTIVNLNARVTDNCPGLQVVFQPPSGSVFPAGSTLVTGTATDAAGNVLRSASRLRSSTSLLLTTQREGSCEPCGTAAPPRNTNTLTAERVSTYPAQCP